MVSVTSGSGMVRVDPDLFLYSCGTPGGCKDVLVSERATSFADCVGWARRRFDMYFKNRIEQLLHNFPPDAVTSQVG